MRSIHPYLLHFSAELGTNEERIESYKWYDETAPQVVTTLGAKNTSGVAGYAGQLAGVLQEI